MKTKYTEITVASILLLVSLFEFVATAHKHVYNPYNVRDPYEQVFAALHLKYSFVSNFVLPELLGRFTFYFSFLWMACSYPDKFLARRQWLGFVLTAALGGVCTWLLLLLGAWLKGFYLDDTLRSYSIYSALTLYGALLVYQGVKYAVLYFLRNRNLNDNSSPLKIEIIGFTVCWVMIMLACFIMNIYWGWQLFFGFMVPCCFIVYAVLEYLIIPQLWDDQISKTKFWVVAMSVTLLINLPFTGYFTYKSAYELWSRLMLFSLAWASQLAILLPLSFYIYYRRKAIRTEITGLQTGLSRADADLSFLRSQIDPHFLFNALNTLYGVALKEKAEDTADGVQKLGDMMRFMLHENNRQHISLGHEIQYLQNYIALQKLRLAESTDIAIKTNFAEVDNEVLIAPMLLIPFVENAFKHGISLKQPSWITTNLYQSGGKLHLEVRNSVFAGKEKKLNDYTSGIGLDNVKKRLELLYPAKHQLDIRQTTSEYLVDLTITL